MARVYKSKGDAAKRVSITVPLSLKARERLREEAAAVGKTPTEVARERIENHPLSAGSAAK